MTEEKAPEAEPNWQNMWACLSDDAKKCLMIAFEMGHTQDPFEVTSPEFIGIYDGLESLGFVERGEVEGREKSNFLYLRGAGYFLILRLKEQGLIL